MKKIILILGMLLLGLTFALADTCTETDGGDDPLVSGTVTYTATNGSSTYTDSCSLSSAGYASCSEYYCSGTMSSVKQYYCDSTTPTVCDTILSSTYSNFETDGGNYPLVAGSVDRTTTYTFSFGNYSTISSSKDACITSGIYSGYLKEYYLRSSTSSTSTRIDCASTYGSSYSCMTDASGFGYCGTSTSIIICTDPDSGLDEYTLSNTTQSNGSSATDYCFSSSKVIEYYCDGPNILNTYIDCASGYVCEDGVCIDSRTSCSSDDDCSEYECAADGYCATSCAADYECNQDAGYICNITTSTCIEASYSAPSVSIEICNNLIDDDSDSLIDKTGGCDSTSDGIIDYVCGCTKGSKILNYGGPSIKCKSPVKYDCLDILTNTSMGLTCGEGEDIEGIYYNPDFDCSGPLKAAGLEEQGFFSMVLNFFFGK